MERILALNPLIPLNTSSFPLRFRAKSSGISRNRAKSSRIRRKQVVISARLDNNFEESKQQQLNLSVLRFTLGIPGLDESYLPRWIGYTFGSLLVLNHFVGSNSSITPAQLRSEALGLCLAAFSVAIPYLGKFLKGAAMVEQSILPEGNKQIFIMSENVSVIQKEDLAWGTYILLKNTNTISVLISAQGALCVRGYWNSPDDTSKSRILEWFERQILQIGLADLKDELYFPQSADSEIWEILPKGTRSLLVQPVPGDPNLSESETTKKIGGFMLLASSMSYAYNDRDRAWIGAIANKFTGQREYIMQVLYESSKLKIFLAKLFFMSFYILFVMAWQIMNKISEETGYILMEQNN